MRLNMWDGLALLASIRGLESFRVSARLRLRARRGAPPPNWTRQQTNPRPLTWGFILERVTRIELALSAWEADVLPLNYTRVRHRPESVSIAWSLYLMAGHRCWRPWGRVRFRGGIRVHGTGVGAYGGAPGEALAWTECRLEGRPDRPVMWLSSSGHPCQTRLFGEGTLGLDGAHRRPLCRWARVHHRFVPDAAGRATRPRTARPVPSVCAASQRGTGDPAEAVAIRRETAWRAESS